MESQQVKRSRSTLAKADAKRRYVEIGVAAALGQIEAEARSLDDGLFAIGPFARLDAGAVAARDGKTRGSVTNLFGSQAVFQAETMALALSANELVRNLDYPKPADFADAEGWVDALFAGQSARGPRHGSASANDYSSLWALWLSAVPYGLWSERISAPSLDEHRQWVGCLETVVSDAASHFGLAFRLGTTAADLASAIASTVEGVWLNQCLTARHPLDASEPISTVLRRAGLLLWRGATEPAPGRSDPLGSMQAKDDWPVTTATNETPAEAERVTPAGDVDAIIRASDLLDQARTLADPDGDSDEAVPPTDVVEAVGLLDRLVLEFGAHEDATVREIVARAMVSKSQALFDLGRTEEALGEIDGLKRRITLDAPEPLRRVLLHALFMTAFCLRGGGEAAAARAVLICRDAVERFGNETEFWFRDWVLTVMVEMGGALEFLERTEEGLALRDDIDARFRGEPDQPLRERAARVAERMGERFRARPR